MKTMKMGSEDSAEFTIQYSEKPYREDATLFTEMSSEVQKIMYLA